MSESVVIANARVVTSEAVLDRTSVRVEQGRIVEIGEVAPRAGDRRIDTAGQWLMPGFIDLHSDAIEKAIEPRPKTFFPVDVAVFELDKKLAAAGVTTMYHSLSFAEQEVGLRSNNMAADILRHINRFAPQLRVRTRVHARFEITDTAAVPILNQLIDDGEVHLLSFMDHTPGQGQFKTMKSFKDYYGPVYKKSDEEMEQIISRKQEAKNNGAEANIRDLHAHCVANRVATASHDDDCPEKVAWLRELGIGLSEFPVNLEAAEAAHTLGMKTLVGAPNVMRGRSQGGNLSARDAIAEGWGHILCSDYAPLALLHAVFALEECGLLSLPEAVRLASLNPAEAVGLGDETGSISVGKAADLILVAPKGENQPAQVVRTWVAGREAYSTWSQ